MESGHLNSGLNTQSNLVHAGESPSDQITPLWFPCNSKPYECLSSELLHQVALSLLAHTALHAEALYLKLQLSS